MKRESPYTYYTLGISLAPINLITEGIALGDLLGLGFSTVLRLLRTLEASRPEDSFGYEETRRTGMMLLGALETYFPPAQVRPVDFERTLTKGESELLLRLAAEFDIALRTELNADLYYHINDVGLYKAATLMRNGEKMFSEVVLTLYPDELTVELREAGKCIAVEIPTGAAFFLFRAVEVAMLECVRVFAPNLTLKDSQRNWGNYIKELGRAGLDARVTSKLLALKDEHRNPLIHPTESVEPEEIPTIIADCTRVINLMAAALANKQNILPNLARLLP